MKHKKKFCGMSVENGKLYTIGPDEGGNQVCEVFDMDGRVWEDVRIVDNKNRVMKEKRMRPFDVLQSKVE